jgi:hypothetical protein
MVVTEHYQEPDRIDRAAVLAIVDRLAIAIPYPVRQPDAKPDDSGPLPLVGPYDGMGLSDGRERAGIDVERWADAFHAKVCGPFATIDPQQCVGGRQRDMRVAEAITAEYDRLGSE